MIDQSEKNQKSLNKLSRIAFGSCNSQTLDQPIWNAISSRNVSAFVWAGDAIYAGEYGLLNRNSIEHYICYHVLSLLNYISFTYSVTFYSFFQKIKFKK